MNGAGTFAKSLTARQAQQFMGHPQSAFECVKCSGAANYALATSLRIHDGEKASVIVAYWLCERCKALYWDEAALEVFTVLKELGND